MMNDGLLELYKHVRQTITKPIVLNEYFFIMYVNIYNWKKQ